MNIDILSNDRNVIDINNNVLLKEYKDNIIKYISETFIQPRFHYGGGDDNIDIINHINLNFKYRYIESLNGIVIATRKQLIQNVLGKLNINIRNKFIQTIILEKKINKLEYRINKIQNIIDNIIDNTINIINPERLYSLNEKMKEHMKMRNIMIYLIQFINKYYKIYYNPQPKTITIDCSVKGKTVEDTINNTIKDILKSKMSECDIMYISNIDYNNIQSKLHDKIDYNNNFKQEIDGMICIKVVDNSIIKWLPIVIIETKTNLNLIYNDINKLNSLHNRLQLFGDMVICDNNTKYHIVGSGFKTCNLFYYVSEINQLISRESDSPYIKFINDNYFSKSIIYEIIMSKIKSNILMPCNTFTDVKILDTYIMSIIHNTKDSPILYNNKLIDQYTMMEEELYYNLRKIQNKSLLGDLLNYDRSGMETIYYVDDSIFLNIDTISYYVFLQKNNIITNELLEIIKAKLIEISDNFIKFETRLDTKILYIG